MRSTTSPTAVTRTAATTSSRVLNIGLWILQVILAALFLWHGWLMVAPPAELVALMNANIAPGFRMFIGVAELLAAAGLILPGLTRILPALTVLAAVGLMIVMSSATVLHLVRGESASALSTAILLALVTAVAWLRWKVAPIPARNQG